MIEQICIEQTLLDSAKEVFETMIFMDLEQCCDLEQSADSDIILGSITFKGEMSGCLMVSCSSSCARAIGMNMLGMEPGGEISQADISDAIGEVTNMIMGSLKTRLQDSVRNLQVSIPIVVKGQGIETVLCKGTSSKKAVVRVNIDSEYIAEFGLLYTEGSKNLS